MARKQSVARRQRWAWAERPVDVAGDHFELRHGSVEESERDKWRPVARVGPPTKSTFPVEWILDRTDPAHRRVVSAVAKELDFYLVTKGEADPWAYAQYHCGTSANMYSHVHWGFHKGTKAPRRRRTTG